MNQDISELYLPVENGVISVSEYLQKDKRTDKNWNEKVMNSALNIKSSLKIFKTLLETHTWLWSFPNTLTYADGVQETKSTVGEMLCTRNVVIVSPKSPDLISDSEQTLNGPIGNKK